MKVCVGFCKVELGEASPKFQFHALIVLVGAAVDVFVKLVTVPTHVEVGEKAATGG